MAAKKYYVVWVGHRPGIYTTWSEAEKQVRGFPGAKFKSFKSSTEAQDAYASGTPTGLTKKRTSATKATPKPSKTVPEADVDIYCDGACDPNPGKAGTGVAVYRNQVLDQLWYGLYNPQGTNNTAELLGLYHSLLMAKDAISLGKSVNIHCDSTYSINSVTKWAITWKAKGWKKPGGEIKNLDLIKVAHELFLEIQDGVTVLHVKGHAGIEGNELADRMSMVAVASTELDLCLFTDTADVAEILALDRG